MRSTISLILPSSSSSFPLSIEASSYAFEVSENASAGVSPKGPGRNEHPALHHQLGQPHAAQEGRFSTLVGPRDEDQVFTSRPLGRCPRPFVSPSRQGLGHRAQTPRAAARLPEQDRERRSVPRVVSVVRPGSYSRHRRPVRSGGHEKTFDMIGCLPNRIGDRVQARVPQVPEGSRPRIVTWVDCR